MLVHHRTYAQPEILPGLAHIVLSIDAEGRVSLRSFCMGHSGCVYRPDADLARALASASLVLDQLKKQLLERDLTEALCARLQVATDHVATETVAGAAHA